MKIQAPPGMRDFYPEEMRLQNWLFDLWRGVSLNFGFSEYEGPIFEYLDLYTLKSGEGIVSELFTIKDRGGRDFAIRPEMTPTLARMVAARANALPHPIKWFCLPRMCRAEKPQRGRLREFFQWNADILGVEDALADAEIIALAVEFFRRAGATEADFSIHISSRPLVAAALASLGVGPEHAPRAFQLIDRFTKLAPPEFAKQWDEALGSAVSSATMRELLGGNLPGAAESANVEEWIVGVAEKNAPVAAARWREFRAALRMSQAAPYCVFDLCVVRGLAYYTGVVFEAYGKAGGARALLGGGRYDDLTGLLDGPRVPGVGFGMGDAPLFEFMKELCRLPATKQTLDVFVVDADAGLFPEVLRLATELRRAGLAADYSYKRAAVGKQFKAAAARNSRYVAVIGEEFRRDGQIVVKDMQNSAQTLVNAAKVNADPRAVFLPG